MVNIILESDLKNNNHLESSDFSINYIPILSEDLEKEISKIISKLQKNYEKLAKKKYKTSQDRLEYKSENESIIKSFLEKHSDEETVAFYKKVSDTKLYKKDDILEFILSEKPDLPYPVMTQTEEPQNQVLEESTNDYFVYEESQKNYDNFKTGEKTPDDIVSNITDFQPANLEYIDPNTKNSVNEIVSNIVPDPEQKTLILGRFGSVQNISDSVQESQSDLNEEDVVREIFKQKIDLVALKLDSNTVENLQITDLPTFVNIKNIQNLPDETKQRMLINVQFLLLKYIEVFPNSQNRKNTITLTQAKSEITFELPIQETFNVLWQNKNDILSGEFDLDKLMLDKNLVDFYNELNPETPIQKISDEMLGKAMMYFWSELSNSEKDQCLDNRTLDSKIISFLTRYSQDSGKSKYTEFFGNLYFLWIGDCFKEITEKYNTDEGNINIIPDEILGINFNPQYRFFMDMSEDEYSASVLKSFDYGVFSLKSKLSQKQIQVLTKTEYGFSLLKNSLIIAEINKINSIKEENLAKSYKEIEDGVNKINQDYEKARDFVQKYQTETVFNLHVYGNKKFGEEYNKLPKEVKNYIIMESDAGHYANSTNSFYRASELGKKHELVKLYKKSQRTRIEAVIKFYGIGYHLETELGDKKEKIDMFDVIQKKQKTVSPIFGSQFMLDRSKYDPTKSMEENVNNIFLESGGEQIKLWLDKKREVIKKEPLYGVGTAIIDVNSVVGGAIASAVFVALTKQPRTTGFIFVISEKLIKTIGYSQIYFLQNERSFEEVVSGDALHLLQGYTNVYGEHIFEKDSEGNFIYRPTGAIIHDISWEIVSAYMIMGGPLGKSFQAIQKYFTGKISSKFVANSLAFASEAGIFHLYNVATVPLQTFTGSWIAGEDFSKSLSNAINSLENMLGVQGFLSFVESTFFLAQIKLGNTIAKPINVEVKNYFDTKLQNQIQQLENDRNEINKTLKENGLFVQDQKALEESIPGIKIPKESSENGNVYIMNTSKGPIIVPVDFIKKNMPGLIEKINNYQNAVKDLTKIFLKLQKEDQQYQKDPLEYYNQKSSTEVSLLSDKQRIEYAKLLTKNTNWSPELENLVLLIHNLKTVSFRHKISLLQGKLPFPSYKVPKEIKEAWDKIRANSSEFFNPKDAIKLVQKHICGYKEELQAIARDFVLSYQKKFGKLPTTNLLEDFTFFVDDFFQIAEVGVKVKYETDRKGIFFDLFMSNFRASDVLSLAELLMDNASIKLKDISLKLTDGGVRIDYRFDNLNSASIFIKDGQIKDSLLFLNRYQFNEQMHKKVNRDFIIWKLAANVFKKDLYDISMDSVGSIPKDRDKVMLMDFFDNYGINYKRQKSILSTIVDSNIKDTNKAIARGDIFPNMPVESRHLYFVSISAILLNSGTMPLIFEDGSFFPDVLSMTFNETNTGIKSIYNSVHWEDRMQNILQYMGVREDSLPEAVKVLKKIHKSNGGSVFEKSQTELLNLRRDISKVNTEMNLGLTDLQIGYLIRSGIMSEAPKSPKFNDKFDQIKVGEYSDKEKGVINHLLFKLIDKDNEVIETLDGNRVIITEIDGVKYGITYMNQGEGKDVYFGRINPEGKPIFSKEIILSDYFQSNNKMHSGFKNAVISQLDNINLNGKEKPGKVWFEKNSFLEFQKGDPDIVSRNSMYQLPYLHIPYQVANAIKGKVFADFNDFKKTFWNTYRDYLNKNYENIGDNNSDVFILRTESGYTITITLGKQKKTEPKNFITYNRKGQGGVKIHSELSIHHILPVREGGKVYDLNNLLILSVDDHILVHKNEARLMSKYNIDKSELLSGFMDKNEKQKNAILEQSLVGILIFNGRYGSPEAFNHKQKQTSRETILGISKVVYTINGIKYVEGGDIINGKQYGEKGLLYEQGKSGLAAVDGNFTTLHKIRKTNLVQGSLDVSEAKNLVGESNYLVYNLDFENFSESKFLDEYRNSMQNNIKIDDTRISAILQKNYDSVRGYLEKILGNDVIGKNQLTEITDLIQEISSLSYSNHKSGDVEGFISNYTKLLDIKTMLKNMDGESKMLFVDSLKNIDFASIDNTIINVSILTNKLDIIYILLTKASNKESVNINNLISKNNLGLSWKISNDAYLGYSIETIEQRKKNISHELAKKGTSVEEIAMVISKDLGIMVNNIECSYLGYGEVFYMQIIIGQFHYYIEIDFKNKKLIIEYADKQETNDVYLPTIQYNLSLFLQSKGFRTCELTTTGGSYYTGNSRRPELGFEMLDGSRRELFNIITSNSKEGNIYYSILRQLAQEFPEKYYIDESGDFLNKMERRQIYLQDLLALKSGDGKKLWNGEENTRGINFGFNGYMDIRPGSKNLEMLKNKVEYGQKINDKNNAIAYCKSMILINPDMSDYYNKVIENINKIDLKQWKNPNSFMEIIQNAELPYKAWGNHVYLMALKLGIELTSEDIGVLWIIHTGEFLGEGYNILENTLFDQNSNFTKQKFKYYNENISVYKSGIEVSKEFSYKYNQLFRELASKGFLMRPLSDKNTFLKYRLEVSKYIINGEGENKIWDNSGNYEFTFNAYYFCKDTPKNFDTSAELGQIIFVKQGGREIAFKQNGDKTGIVLGDQNLSLSESLIQTNMFYEEIIKEVSSSYRSYSLTDQTISFKDYLFLTHSWFSSFIEGVSIVSYEKGGVIHNVPEITIRERSIVRRTEEVNNVEDYQSDRSRFAKSDSYQKMIQVKEELETKK